LPGAVLEQFAGLFVKTRFVLVRHTFQQVRPHARIVP
jgi:hypothetical protein